MSLFIRNVTRALLLVFVSWSFLSVIPDILCASEKEFRNSVGMEFALIPAGTFTMGSPVDEPSKDSDEVQHQVTITKPFYLQTTEVTQSQARQRTPRQPFVSSHRPFQCGLKMMSSSSCGLPRLPRSCARWHWGLKK